MNTQRRIVYLSSRDQRWLSRGLAFGALLKQAFQTKDERDGTNMQPGAYHQA